MFAALLVLAVLPLFHKGLYFADDQLVAVACGSLLFAVAAWFAAMRWREGLVVQPLDAATLGLAAAYVLSVTVAADPREAIQWALLYVTYFFVYWMVSRFAARGGEGRATRRVETVLYALAGAALAVALIGLAAAGRLLPPMGMIADGRIFATFQYPNTTAAFLTGGLLLTLALWGFHEERREESAAGWWTAFMPASLYALAGCVMLVVIVFTKSRGALLVVPVALAANFAFAPPGRRLAFCTRTAVVLVAAAAGLRFVAEALTWRYAAPLIPAFSLSIASLAVTLPLHARLRTIDPRRARLILAALALAGAAAVAGAFAFHLVPKELLSRPFSMRQYSAYARTRWTLDALQALRDHPLLGVGGGGWNAVQFSVQRYAYYARHVHNHFVQIPLETGIPGAIAFVSIWTGAALAGSWVLRRWRDGRRWLAAGTLASAFALGVHSALDFNLALAAFAIVLWTLFGCLAAMDRLGARDDGPPDADAADSRPWNTIALKAAGVLALIPCACAISLYLAWGAGQRGARAMVAEDRETAAAELERARALDPWTSSFAVDLAAMREQEGRLAEAEALLRRAIALSPYESARHAALGRFLLRHRRTGEGLAELRKASDLRPCFLEPYQDYSRAAFVAGASELTSGGGESGRRWLAEVLETPERMRRTRALEPPPLARFQRAGARSKGFTMRLPESTPALDFDSGRAALLLGRAAEAVPLLERAARDASVQPDVFAWLATACERAGDRERAERYRDRAVSADVRMIAMIDQIGRAVPR